MTRRNVNLANSKGISKHEFKVGTNAAYLSDREVFNDVNMDLLAKLSPEDLAWYAEFLANTYQGFEVDPEIVGEEAAAKMNTKASRNAGYTSKNHRQVSPYTKRKRTGIQAKTEKGTYEEVLPDDSFTKMEDEIEDSIDSYWAEKKS